ncbi:MAG: TadE family protein [Actinomycetota bacterium]
MPDRHIRRGRERGSATVEFALVLPIVLAMVLALAQIGLLARDRLTLEYAARAGAREAAVSVDEASVRAAVDGAAPDLGTSVSMTIRRPGSVGDPVTVDITTDRAILVPLVGWLFPSSVAMTASATMRQEVP